jgi:hypothetical protein
MRYLLGTEIGRRSRDSLVNRTLIGSPIFRAAFAAESVQFGVISAIKRLCDQKLNRKFDFPQVVGIYSARVGLLISLPPP